MKHHAVIAVNEITQSRDQYNYSNETYSDYCTKY